MAAQWLGKEDFIAEAWVWSLVQELGSCKLHGMANKIKGLKIN